ncbi:hypothetical protein IscW_ISCW003330 [Ixodes scapularis]|uniref:Uncharacterized protein n=1 Tax=Ixodes scapularis TaxID=6945 RepID=B7PCV2_IXOSC|nr:hypothetical protein IscW_ISCW003330 [Ixodes scapularis]|eukprot:XP_002410313.1 hypothetical protein IscW_ISCW003330 [Ixodes scapularis]
MRPSSKSSMAQSSLLTERLMALPVAGGRGCCTQAELLEVVGPEKEQALPLPPATLRGGAGAADFFIRDLQGPEEAEALVTDARPAMSEQQAVDSQLSKQQ